MVLGSSLIFQPALFAWEREKEGRGGGGGRKRGEAREKGGGGGGDRQFVWFFI